VLSVPLIVAHPAKNVDIAKMIKAEISLFRKR
jgi:hypothetical protein